MGRRVLGVVITVIAVATSVLSSIIVFGAHAYDPVTRTVRPTWWPTLSLLAAIGAAVMLCWRHRWPVLVAGIAAVPPLLLAADALAALIALAALAANRRDRLLWVGTAVVFTATALALGRDVQRNRDVTFAGKFVGTSTGVGQIITILLMSAVMTAIPLAVGIRRGVRGELAMRKAKEQELRAEMARREERTRIAREMHDVLGHRLSLLSLQAGALEVSQGAEAARATEAARIVRTTARQSLEDLRQVIGVLRDGQGFTPRDEAPRPAGHDQPGLAALPELIANARRSGLAVNVMILIDVAAAPAPLGTAAYRIIQESLTNVMKHAPGAGADVSVRGGPGLGVTIEVVNPLPATPLAEPAPGSGTGLTGIAERATLLGGNVTAGPADGIFAIRAWLPWARQ